MELVKHFKVCRFRFTSHRLLAYNWSS
jgi:hypothetical protein